MRWDSKIDSIWRMNKWNKLIFGMLMQIHNSWKLMKNLFGGHGQKWVWPVWILDSKIYNLIFCMLVQVQGGWKLIQSFLSVLCQRWQWLFSSWDPKTCILKMNLWIELIILMLIVMQQFLVRLISYSLAFKFWGSAAVVLLVSFVVDYEVFFISVILQTVCNEIVWNIVNCRMCFVVRRVRKRRWK